MPLDSAAWLTPVEDGSPAGSNLEFDADFVALEQAAEFKPEQQFGDTVIPAVEPDWKDVAARADALLERTRDLRVMTHLASARLRLGGLPAFVSILGAVREVLSARWAEVHPQLDPEDDNDPTLRANALLGLTDPAKVLRFLRDMPIARSPRLGHYSWRELSAAITGELSDGAPSQSVISSAFQDTDPAWSSALRAAAAEGAEAARGIVDAFEAAAGSGTGPDFEALIKLLKEIAFAIGRYGPAAGEAAGAADEQAAEEIGAAGDVGAAQPGPAAARLVRAAAPVQIQEVTTRAEAVRLLDLVCTYYRRNEPSSPLPLLIERAKRLAEKDFIEILRDLAPDGLQQARSVAGVQDE